MTAQPTRERNDAAAQPEASQPGQCGLSQTSLAIADSSLPTTPRSIQDRLEHLLRDDRELLIALECQLEQIRRELRLLNDDRLVRILDRDLGSSRRH